MRPGVQTQFVWPKPGRMLIGLIAANIVLYVLELFFLRAGFDFVRALFLSPADIFERGFIWQPLTYMWLHSPDGIGHLLFNMLWLWLFGSKLESWWGPRRFLSGYLMFGLGGAALTLLIALLSQTSVFGPLLQGFWVRPHVGASGAVMGIVVAWGLAYANQEMHFFLLGRMKGKTFVLIIIAIELLQALSFSPISSTSHFGGMAMAFVVCRGLWRPSFWQSRFRRDQLKRKRKKIEHQLQVLQGGKSDDLPDDPKQWN